MRIYIDSLRSMRSEFVPETFDRHSTVIQREQARGLYLVDAFGVRMSRPLSRRPPGKRVGRVSGSRLGSGVVPATFL
jgi:hypothetical protein